MSNRSFFGRVMVYLWETYPPPAALVLANLQFFCLYTLVFWVNDGKEIIVNSNAIAGVVTCFLFMLFLRVADELKDVEVDASMFPERPLPSGRVLESDLWIVLIVTLQSMFMINTYFPEGMMTFIALAIFALLTFKYFFLEEYIANNLLMAFLTHNPLTLLTGIYIISIPVNSFSWSLWSIETMMLAVWFWFFGIIWEFTRKIRAPENETSYMTYSRLFGLRNSILLTSALMVTQFTIITILSFYHPMRQSTLILLFSVLAMCIGYFVMFLNSKNKPRFKILAAGAAYLFINLVVILIEMVSTKSFIWQ